MAVVSHPYGGSLKIIVETGRDEENKAIYRTRTYNRVKPSASDEDLLEVAKQLIDLQTYPVDAVRRVVETELMEE